MSKAPKQNKNTLTIIPPGPELRDVKHFLAKFPLDAVDLTAGNWQLGRDRTAAASTSSRTQQPELLPFRLENAKGSQYKGMLEGGANGKPQKEGYFVLFRKDKSKSFTAVPVEWWYNFKKERSNTVATLEEAEQALRDRQKHQEARAKQDLRKSSLFAEEEEEEAPKRATKAKVPDFLAVGRGGGKKGKQKVVDDVLGDDGDDERPGMELESLMEMDEERAEGWDYEEDVANDDVTVTVNPELEKEENEEEAARLESEILRDNRAKERDGIVVDDEELPDYDVDDDVIAQRRADHEEARRQEKEIRKKLKATGLFDDEDDSSDDDADASLSRPGSSAGTPSVAPTPEVPPGSAPLTPGADGKSSAEARKPKTSKRALPPIEEGDVAKRQRKDDAGAVRAPAPAAAVVDISEAMYAEMRAIITNNLRSQGQLTIPKILGLLKNPSLPWASLAQQELDRFVGQFVKLACGKIKHPKFQSFLLTEKRDAANKIIVELAPTAS